MEVVVQFEASEEGLIKDNGEPGSELATLDPVADPVVYKLVKNPDHLCHYFKFSILSSTIFLCFHGSH
ncbi:hypothetical protein KSS87_001638, partial [Heliosperma pusillum]